MRTGAWYRKRGGWVAIIAADAVGYTVVLKRNVGVFDDALAHATEVLEQHTR